MKNNTNNIKIQLEKTLKNVPDDFALSEVKQYIKLAIKKIEDIENKREKREKLKNKRTQKIKLKVNSIDIIDKMIEVENNKLNTLESKETFLEN